MKANSRVRTVVVLVLAAAMVMATFTTAMAKKSINDDTNKPRVDDSITGSGLYPLDDDLISTDVDTSKYDNKTVADVVEKVNGGTNLTPADIVDNIPQSDDKKDPENFPTEAGYDVNLKLYDRISDFYDIEYTYEGLNTDKKPGETKLVLPDTKGMKGSDLMIMLINTETGEIMLIPPTSFDSETGTITFDLPHVGAYCVLHKIPIVVRNVDPDLYPNEELGEQVAQLPDNEVIVLKDFLEAIEAEETDEIEVAEDIYVDTDKYSSAIALSDVAVQLSIDSFSYDLPTKFKANLFRGNDKVDWERILTYAGVEYDKDAILEDDEKLTEIEPVKLEDCFVYHVDATTREVSIIYEPTVCWSTYGELTQEKEEELTEDDIVYFDVDDIEAQNVEETKLNLDAEDEEESSVVEEVYAETELETALDAEANDDDVCLVINGDHYIGMGPFLLMMPINEGGFPWWILLVIAAAGGGAYIYSKNKKKEDEQNA